MEYGYGYLNPKNLGGLDNAEDLESLRPYLCPKSGGDPGRCKNCPGLRSCQAGQKAAIILDRAVEKTGKWEKAWAAGQKSEMPAQKKPEPISTAKDRETFRTACESGNARMWLIRAGYSEASAQEKLIFWVSHYPDITKEFGRKRILQKPCKVIVTSVEVRTEEPNAPLAIAPQAADLPHRGAAETKVEKMADQSAEAPERPEKPQENERKHSWSAEAVESLRRKREAAVRERCMEALASGDPVGYLMSQGITRKAARQNLRRWQERFPDLFPDEKGPEETAPDSVIVQTPDSIIVQTEEDEINLSDFLRQYGVPILSETPEPVVEQKDEPEENPNRELARLMDQEVKLLEQVADLQGQIWEIRAKRRKIEEKMSH